MRGEEKGGNHSHPSSGPAFILARWSHGFGGVIMDVDQRTHPIYTYHRRDRLAWVVLARTRWNITVTLGCTGPCLPRSTSGNPWHRQSKDSLTQFWKSAFFVFDGAGRASDMSWTRHGACCVQCYSQADVPRITSRGSRSTVNPTTLSPSAAKTQPRE